MTPPAHPSILTPPHPLTNLCSPTAVRSLLQSYNLHTRKSLGQHYLVDANVLHRIVDAAEIPEGGWALEIGPGLGVLTRELSKVAGQVAAIEYDRTLLPLLHDTLVPLGNVKIVEGDAVRILRNTSLSAIFLTDAPAGGPDEQDPGGAASITCVSNLPYNITSPVIIALLHAQEQLRSIVIMIQEEVAERLAAAPGSGNYGAISVFVQYHARVERVLAVNRHCFYPPPNVESAIVKLTPLPGGSVPVQNPTRLFEVSRALFGQRRKTASNALMTMPGLRSRDEIVDALQRAGIDPGCRGEQLSVGEMACLADALG